MKLYYVCTNVMCGHRWTEWSILLEAGLLKNRTHFVCVVVWWVKKIFLLVHIYHLAWSSRADLPFLHVPKIPSMNETECFKKWTNTPLNWSICNCVFHYRLNPAELMTRWNSITCVPTQIVAIDGLNECAQSWNTFALLIFFPPCTHCNLCRCLFLK